MKKKLYQFFYRFRGGVLILIFALLQTTTLQHWIGEHHLYGPRQFALKNKTLELHEAILTNKLKEGKTWNDYGGGSLNHRIGAVYIAEALRRISGKSLFSIYKWMDHAALFSVLVILFLFLRTQASSEYALIGTLFFATSQVTTYFYHYFHPWDRISQLLWVLGLWFVSKNQLKRVIAILVLGVIVKYDFLMLASVYTLFLFFSGRAVESFWKGGTVTIVGIVTFLCVRALIPNSDISVSPVWDRDWSFLSTNLYLMKEAGLTYPPILVFSVPTLITLFGWNKLTPFQKGGAITALIATPIYFLTSFFNETRAEMPLLMMLLPSALRASSHLLQSDEKPPRGKSLAEVEGAI